MRIAMVIAAGGILFATPALAVVLPVTLDATPTTLSRTSSVSVALEMKSGAVGRVDFTADEIAAGTVSKDHDVVALDEVAACKATWLFQPAAEDVVPQGGMSLDNVDFDCTIDGSRGVAAITPLTSAQTLTLTVPAAAFTQREATSVQYLLRIKQEHGPAWTYGQVAKSLPATGEDVVSEHVVFTGGCLTFELGARWQASDGTVVTDPTRFFMGEGFTLE